MPTDPLARPASGERLRSLAAAGHLSRVALERAMVLTEQTPGVADWRRFISYLLLVLGAALTLSGVIFFFAYNWAAMDRIVKFAVIDAAILAAVALAHFQGLQTLVGKVALLAAAVLVGALLAVYGQAYQTGADSFQLFLTWAALIVGWVLIGRSATLWLLLLVLLNVGLILYWNQRVSANDRLLFNALALLNAASLICWEFARSRGVGWLGGRWFPQLIALTTFGFLIIPTLESIFFDGRRGLPLLLAPLFYAVLALCVVLFYYRVVRDLLMLTICAFSAIVVITSLAYQALGASFMQDEFNVFILLSLLMIAQAGLAAYILRQVARSWELQDQ